MLRHTQTEFRHLLFEEAVRALRLEGFWKPYGLRRGGTTALVQACGAMDTVCDVGRWGNPKTCRIYVSTALSELADQDQAPTVARRVRQFSERFAALAAEQMPARKGARGEILNCWHL